jgi:DNA-binding HxlR family transcriptional regulator
MIVRVIAALACGHVDWVCCDEAHVMGVEALPETLWCGHCGSWQLLIEFVTDPGEFDALVDTRAPLPGQTAAVSPEPQPASRNGRRARSMREELTTDLYHLNRIRRHDWDTTIMALLQHGPRRPGDVVAAAVGWRFYDPWEGRIRKLAESRVREALSTLVKLGLAEKDMNTRSGRDLQYKLTPAGADYIAVMEFEREWLARYPNVLDNAVCAFRDDQRSRIAGDRYRSSRRESSTSRASVIPESRAG